MLEIIALILLCRRNAKKAKSRGRKPTGFVFMTIGLWVGLEFIGIFVGTLIGINKGLELEEYIYQLYIPAVIMATIGAVLSVVITNNCKKGDYVPPEAFLQGTPAANANAAGSLQIDSMTGTDSLISNRSTIAVTVVGVQMFGPISVDLLPGESKRIAQDVRANVYEQGKCEYNNMIYEIGRRERWEVVLENDQPILRKL